MTLNEKLDLIRQARDSIKTSLASKGQEVNTDIRTYAEAIDSINVGVDTSDATATAIDMISPKTAYVNGEKIEGSIQPTYKSVDATLYKPYTTSAKVNSTFYRIDTLKVDDYSFVILQENSNIHFIIVKNKQLECDTIIPYAQLGLSSTNIGGIALNLSEKTDNYIDLTLAIGYNDGNGSSPTAYGRYRYSFKDKSITKNGTTKYIYNLVNNTGNNYGYAICAIKGMPNVFVMYYSRWQDVNNVRVDTVSWSADGTATIKYYNFSGVFSFSYNKCETTGDGSWFIHNRGLGKMFPDATNFYAVATAGPCYISHNLTYMVMNNILYKVDPTSTTPSALYNSRVQIKSGIPSYNAVGFSENDDYMVLYRPNNTIEVYTFDYSGYTLIQTIPISGNKNMPFNSNQIFGALQGSTVVLQEYDKGTELIALERDSVVFRNTLDTTASVTDILSDKTAYIKGSKVVGLMSNNGELEYTPTESTQTIPAGYTSGGKVNPMNVTTSTVYKQAIAILKDIRPTVSTIYKQIDYIGGTGSQRLYTGIQTDSATDTYEITLRDTDMSSWEYYFLFGAIRLARYTGTSFCLWAGTNRPADSFTLGNINDGNWHTIKVTPNAISLDGSQKLSYSIGGTSTGTINIFYPGDTTSKFLVKEFKMYRAGELISHLIPYKNIQTNIVGMYDLIGNKFYNNTGSGTFTSGNIIGDIDVEDYTLTQRLLELQDYINQNIVPVNIRADKTIFDVTGTAPVTFSTIEEMNEHTDLAEDTLAIVYGTSYVGTYRLDNGTWTQIGDSTEEQQIMNVLNDVVASTEQYEGIGGTDEEINEVFNDILGSN